MTNDNLGRPRGYLGDAEGPEQMVVLYSVVCSLLRILPYHVCKLKKDSDIVCLEMVPLGHGKCCSDLKC